MTIPLVEFDSPVAVRADDVAFRYLGANPFLTPTTNPHLAERCMLLMRFSMMKLEHNRVVNPTSLYFDPRGLLSGIEGRSICGNAAHLKVGDCSFDLYQCETVEDDGTAMYTRVDV